MRLAHLVFCAVLTGSIFSADAATAEPSASSLLAAPWRPEARQSRAVGQGEAIAHERPTGEERTRGIATTSVDHEFGGRGLTGQAGFLCGLAPGHNDRGAAAANGYDPQGRFLGAKLSLAFR